MAPPFGLVFSRGAPVSADQAISTGANASLTSNTSMSSTFRPALASACSVAGIGPVSMKTGSAPTTARATTRAPGVSPCRSTAASEATSSAAEPSDLWDAAAAAVSQPSPRRDAQARLPDSQGGGGKWRARWRGAALPVDGAAGHALGQSRRQPRLPRDVQRLRADLGNASHDHVFDRGRVDAGAYHEFTQHVRGEVHRVEPRQPPVPLPDRGPDRSDDVCLSHDTLRGCSGQARRRATLVQMLPPGFNSPS